MKNAELVDLLIRLRNQLSVALAWDISAVLRSEINVAIMKLQNANNPQHTAMKHHLEDKFLITGAETLQPRPAMPYASLEEATETATAMIHGRDFQQNAVIVWAPVRVIERTLAPVVVRAPSTKDQAQ